MLLETHLKKEKKQKSLNEVKEKTQSIITNKREEEKKK